MGGVPQGFQKFSVSGSPKSRGNIHMIINRNPLRPPAHPSRPKLWGDFADLLRCQKSRSLFASYSHVFMIGYTTLICGRLALAGAAVPPAAKVIAPKCRVRMDREPTIYGSTRAWILTKNRTFWGLAMPIACDKAAIFRKVRLLGLYQGGRKIGHVAIKSLLKTIPFRKAGLHHILK